MRLHKLSHKGILCILLLGIAAGCFGYPSNKAAEARHIDEQISYIWEHTKNYVRDYDDNGEVNCCDVATAFCIRWKSVYSMPIRLCQQQTAKINHMYVQILTSWGWWSVDPQYSNRNGSHDMKDVWGLKYSIYGDDTNGYWVRFFSKYIE